MNVASANSRAYNGNYSEGGGTTLVYVGLIAYTVIFYTQLAARIPMLSSFRLELVIGSILVVVVASKFLTARLDFRENRLNIAALFFLLAACLTIPFALWRTQALNTMIRLLKFFAIYLMIIAAIHDEKRLRVFMYVYLFLIALLFVEPFLLSLRGAGFVYNNHMWRLAGVTGYFAHPNQLAGITSANLPFLYYLMKYERSKTIKVVCIALIIVALRVIMLTQSRTGFLGVIAFGFFVWWFSQRKIVLLMLLIMSCVAAWHLAPQTTKDRFLTLRDADEVISETYTTEEAGSMAARWILTKHAVEVFIEHPLIGVGLDNFKVVSLRKWHHWIPPHNTYLQALAEMGLIGFAAFLIVLAAIFKNLKETRANVRELKEPDGFLAFMSSALTVYLLVRMVVSVFGIELYDNYWWLAGGLSVVTLRIARQKQPSSVETEPVACV